MKMRKRAHAEKSNHKIKGQSRSLTIDVRGSDENYNNLD